MISLETPIGDEEDSHLGDFIEDRSIISPSESVISVNLADQNPKVLATLTPREGPPHTVRHRREVRPHPRGSGPGLRGHARADPPDRSEVLRKLRHPLRSKRLKAFVETKLSLSDSAA